MNLVTNAVEAVSGKGEVLLKTENRLVKESHGRFEEIAEGEYVLFIIADSGMGIDADDSERIFEPFFTKKKMGRSGTGLGMTIVWGAVKDHGGYIDMESRKGEGTTFTVYLPADVCAKREYETVPVDPVRRNYRGKGETILVVDDDENQREVMTSLLDVMNYKVIAVPSGEAALEYLKMHSADLVLLDMIMGSGMDGLETYRGIARRRPFQKTVIVSGYSDTERIREAQKLGAGPYIRKPCKLEVLSKTVREELDK
jgi:CheY-like chemotaxis protein